MHAWTLPEFIADLLPLEASHLENIRRAMLDRFKSYGYQLVQPPLVEYVESLQLQGHTALEMQTFRLVDQLSGRQMGLRADMTPQAARIDAHLLNQKGITRLCYAGPVAHTQPRDLLTTREPFQIGAELYGHAGLDADVEIISLLLQTLHAAGAAKIHLDIGHVDIQRGLLAGTGLADDHVESILTALHNKDSSTLAELTHDLKPEIAQSLQALPNLYGGVEVLARARAVLAPIPQVQEALNTLERVAQLIGKECHLRIDLAEQRVGAYHSGLVFAAYVEGSPTTIARGGRYDDVGRQFGRARAAVGFSLDVRELIRLTPKPEQQLGIFAPAKNDQALQDKITDLRQAGEIVIVDLAASADAMAHHCNRRLVQINDQWQIEQL